jgi:uncharacterized protein (TIGR03382 family)
VAHDILTSDCSGDARFTRLEPWADLIEQALTDTGGCIPVAWDDPCGDGVDNDCDGTVDNGCVPPDEDAGGGGDDAGVGGDDAGGGTDTGGGDDAGTGTDTSSGADTGGDYTGTVKGGCSTTGGNPGLAVLALFVMLARVRARSRP